MENKDELIVIKQLPIIEEQLKSIGAVIDEKVAVAMAMECTEDNKQDVKKKRTELSNDFKYLEEKRKEVKEKISKPYKDFEEVYKKYVTDKFCFADKDLKNKIDIIEAEQKKKLEDEARYFFDELKESKHIEFIKFEDMNLKVGLSDNPTKLKKEITSFITKIEDDLKLIEVQQYKEEILVEYMRTLNVSKSVTDVQDRHFVLESLKKAEEKQKTIQENEEATVAKVEDAIDGQTSIDDFIEPPKEIEINNEEKLVMTFTVKASLNKLKQLKQFLIEGEYDYE